MNLGEKIFKLRKEKGLSQEALAEQLGTTRQAISKWENNQGFPETEKLLQLSNVFGVSTDFLLKDEKSVKSAVDDKGYYVSREMAQGYLANEKRIAKYISLGYMFCALAGIPYILFAANTVWRLLGMASCVIIGIILCVLGIFTENVRYKPLKQEPLLFDYAYLKELSNEYRLNKKKYSIVAIPCTILFIVGILALALASKSGFSSAYHAFIFLIFAVGLLGFTYSACVMEAYELLVNHEQYAARLLFKLKRKVRAKIDKL